MRKTLVPHLAVLALGLLNMGKAAVIEYPPFPNPLPYTGFSISKLMERIDWVDPIYFETNECSSSEEIRIIDQNGDEQTLTAGNNTTLKLCLSRGDAGTYADALLNFAQGVIAVIVAQFTGDAIAKFFLDPNVTRVYLHQILDGLKEAYRSVPNQDPETTFNYLGKTLENIATAYRDILMMIRVARIYGDEALNNYVQGLLDGLFRKFVGKPLEDLVKDAKSVFMNTYNKQGYAATLYELSNLVREFISQYSGQVQRFVKDNAIGGKRSVPYVDSTIAWLVENASIAEAQVAQAQSALTTQGLNGGLQAQGVQPLNANASPESALAPNQLAFIMAAKSPEVLRSLQSIAERQANLRAQVTEKIANIDRVASEASKQLLGERSLPKTISPYAQEEKSFVLKLDSMKTQTDLRDIVKTQTEIVGWMAMNQLTSSQNLELLLLRMVEEEVKTRQILLEESTKEIQEQIAQLEGLKNEILSSVLSLAEDASKSLSLLDNIDSMVSVLAVSDRAGMILTEEQFDRLLQNQQGP